MIEQKYKIVLLLVIFLIGSGCSDTSHLKNVKFKVVDETTREPLKNRELNICKFVYFKLKLGARSPYLDKDADWYITSVVTDENGVFMLDLSSIKETHIVVEPAMPYNITRFSRASDLAGTKSVNHIRVTHFPEGLTNRIYDLRSGTAKVIADSGETMEEPFTEILLTVRKRENVLSSKAEALMFQFQQALKDSDWDKALGLCSQNVKSKVSDYSLAEAFFKEIVPVDEIASLSRFWTSGGRYNRDGQQVEFHCFLRIPTADPEETIDWIWTVGKSDKGWVIDFETMSLEKWIEKETARRNRETEETLRKREELKKGIEIRLTALSKEFVIGQPMLFRIEMTNISKSPIRYKAISSVMVNEPMIVTGPNENNIKYVDASYQTGVRDEEIEPGETIILADKYDVASQYRIIKAGKYNFQFNGIWPPGIGPSNIVEIDVMPGGLSPADSIVERLLPVLPEGWVFTRRLLSKKTSSESKLNGCICVHLIGESRRKAIDEDIGVLIVVNPTEDVVSVEPEWFEGHLWGRCKWGPVYVKSFDADLLWEDYKEQIIKALGIKKVKSD